MALSREIVSGDRYPVAMAHATKVTDVEVEKRLKAIEFARGSIAHLVPPGVSLADELIADRRAEARAEDHEAEARQLSDKRLA